MNHIQKIVKFIESYKRKKSVQFFGSYKKRFNSLSRIQKKFNDVSQFKSKAQLFESHWKKFKSLSHIQKKFNSLSMLKKSNSLRHMEKRVQFFESYCKMVQFFELYFLEEKWFISLSHVQILWVNVEKMFNTVSHVEKNEGFNSLSHVEPKGSILWVILKRGFQFCELYFLKEKWFNSLNHVQKVGSISMSQCWRKGFNSLSHVEKEGFNSLSHVEQKGSILWVMLNRRVQFCQSFWKEGFNSVSLIKKKGSIQWIIFFEKFNSWSQNQKKVSMLRVFLFFPIKIKFIESHSEKKFNSLS